MITLEDLVAPLSSSEFIESFFIPQNAFVSHPNVALIDLVAETKMFSDPIHFLSQFERVALFGPNGFRSVVPGRVAYDFYRRGDTLYVTGVERVATELVEQCRGVATELGIPPQAITIEAFAARAGAVSTLHYDDDANFQMLVSGAKRWRVRRNDHIHYPLIAHQRLNRPREEAFAVQLPLPTRREDLTDMTTFDALPGTSTFIPLGMWHEVESLEDSFAINLALRPDRWIDAIGRSVRRSGLGLEPLRAPVWGACPGAHPRLARYAALASGEARSAYWSAFERVFDGDFAIPRDSRRWRRVSTPGDLKLEDVAGSVYPDPGAPLNEHLSFMADFIGRLSHFAGSFGVDDLKQLAPGYPLTELLRVLERLTDAGVLERNHE